MWLVMTAHTEKKPFKQTKTATESSIQSAKQPLRMLASDFS